MYCTGTDWLGLLPGTVSQDALEDLDLELMQAERPGCGSWLQTTTCSYRTEKKGKIENKKIPRLQIGTAAAPYAGCNGKERKGRRLP